MEPNVADNEADKPERPQKKQRPGFRQLIRSYRLVRYLKPYKKQMLLMFLIIFVYSACHLGAVMLVRELLEEGLWISPEPWPEMSINDVITKDLPAQLKNEAVRITGEKLEDCLKAAMSKKLLKRISRETIDRAKQRIEKRSAKDEVKIAEAIKPITNSLDEKMAPGVTREIYRQIGEHVLDGLRAKLSAEERIRFETACRTAFAPPPANKVNVAHIGLLCLGVVATAILVAVTIFFRVLVKAHIISRATFDIRSSLCDHLLSLDMKFFTGRSSGETISRQTNDIVAGTKALIALFDELVVQPFLAVAYAVAAFIVSWQLALAFCSFLILLPFPVIRIARRVKKYGRQKLERIAELMNIMSEIFQGMRVTKAFCIEAKKHEEFKEANERYVSRLFKTMKLKGLSDAVTEAFVNVCVAGVMFIAAFLVTTGVFGVRLSPPDVIAFSGCMLLLYRPIKAFTKAYPEFMESIAASERVFELLDIEPEVREAPDAIELQPIAQSIAFRNVTFSYDGPVVLHDITFDVRRGQMVAIVGHSGAGKSTLLDLVPRFYDPNPGTIEIDGIDIRKATLRSLRRQIAVVSQDPFLFHSSIADNIRYGRLGADDNDIVAAATAANIHDFIKSLPQGYDTLCGERGVKLSGGQRQRITIARAILKDAPILILDEATSSLDTESEQLVREALDRLMTHRTTFVIAHRLSTVQNADLIIVLRDGRLIEKGTHAELIEMRGEYWRLYKTQFEASASTE